MWNCVSKSLKGILEKNRRKCWNIPATKVTQKSRCNNCFLRLSPEIVEHLNRYYDYYKSCGAEKTYKEKQQKERKAKRGFSFDNLQINWLENLKNWSVIIAVGLYLLQPFGTSRKILFPTDLETDSLSKSTRKYLGSIFTNVVPKCYILPEIKAAGKIIKAEAATRIEASSSNSEAQTETADELKKAHDVALGFLYNYLGTDCMESGKHKEAVDFFIEAAKVNNAAALFNLGICYERGVGITKDFKKAAELYRKASDLGHAKAMFNLGVYHVHGWGGLEASVYKARELFQAAANLGQAEAVKLLHLNKVESEDALKDSMDLKENTSHVQNYQEHSEPSTSTGRSRTSSLRENYSLKSSNDARKVNIKEIKPEMTDSAFLWYHTLDIPIERSLEQNSHKKVEQLTSVDSGVLDLSSEEAINIFV